MTLGLARMLMFGSSEQLTTEKPQNDTLNPLEIKMTSAWIPHELCRFEACAYPQRMAGGRSVDIDVLLIDHANCEKKAASTALNLMYRYVEEGDLLLRLSALAERN